VRRYHLYSLSINFLQLNDYFGEMLSGRLDKGIDEVDLGA